MPLVFAALCPHPPLLIPEVGKEMTKKVKNTITSYETLANDLEVADPDAIIVLSPHNLVYADAFNINSMAKLQGDFSEFDAPKVKFSFSNDLELVDKIVAKADQENIPVVPYDNGASFFQLDHGTLVPLYFLTQEIGSQTPVIPMAYSFADKTSHFVFGQLIRDVFLESDKRVAFIASGDLSHRLMDNQPISIVAKKFDTDIQSFLKTKDNKSILSISDETRSIAGECAYNSIVTLLGVLDGIDYQPEILSYEAPFGVGYLTVNFQLSSINDQ